MAYLKNCCAERHTFTPKVCDIRAKTPSAAHLIHGDTRDTRGAASRRPHDQGSVCARAHRRSGAACFLSLSHCPLPMQNFVLSESCAHLFFCMRLAEGISWPAAASAGSRSSLEGANLGFGCCCLQATNVASRQQFVAVHVQKDQGCNDGIVQRVRSWRCTTATVLQTRRDSR